MRKGLVTNLARQRLATPSEQWTGDPEGGGINTGQPNSRVEPNQATAQCLKIKKVSFEIASEASYVYIFSGHKWPN